MGPTRRSTFPPSAARAFNEHGAIQAANVLTQELEALDARIERSRERLKGGDPDLTADELQAAIDRAEAKRR
jgi:hypothetical protein